MTGKFGRMLTVLSMRKLLLIGVFLPITSYCLAQKKISTLYSGKIPYFNSSVKLSLDSIFLNVSYFKGKRVDTVECLATQINGQILSVGDSVIIHQTIEIPNENEYDSFTIKPIYTLDRRFKIKGGRDNRVSGDAKTGKYVKITVTSTPDRSTVYIVPKILLRQQSLKNWIKLPDEVKHKSVIMGTTQFSAWIQLDYVYVAFFERNGTLDYMEYAPDANISSNNLNYIFPRK